MSKGWLITGSSRGLGRDLAKAVLPATVSWPRRASPTPVARSLIPKRI